MNAVNRIAFVSPRFADGSTVGGAETLLRNLAEHAAQAGRRVTFLTTCARDHFTWRNEIPVGERDVNGVRVRYFPVDEDRDVDAFLHAQQAICSRRVTPDRQVADIWLRNSVNSRALIEHLRSAGDDYDRFIMGPYLFGLVYHAALVHPDRTLLVPCLHDEPFARLAAFGEMFRAVRGCMFNTVEERDLAVALHNVEERRSSIVGMGLDPFTAEPGRFQRPGLRRPYVMYSGRREPMKGTPLLCDYMAAFRARTGRDVCLLFTGSGPIDAPPEIASAVFDAAFVSETDKRDAMAGALAFCHPSVNESLGIVLLEAWMAGAPALVHAGSKVLAGHCRRSGGGLWFRTYAEFEEELLLLLDQPDLRRRLGQAGREYVLREYAWEQIRERLFRALA